MYELTKRHIKYILLIILILIIIIYCCTNCFRLLNISQKNILGIIAINRLSMVTLIIGITLLFTIISKDHINEKLTVDSIDNAIPIHPGMPQAYARAERAKKGNIENKRELYNIFNKLQKGDTNKKIHKIIIIISICLLTIEYILNLIYEIKFGKNIISWIIIIYSILLLITYFYRNNLKEINIKLIKIDYIDYMRSRLIFKQNNNIIYFFDTDFGEKFELNQQYSIKLYGADKKIKTIQYEGNLINTFQILGVSIYDFKKI